MVVLRHVEVVLVRRSGHDGVVVRRLTAGAQHGAVVAGRRLVGVQAGRLGDDVHPAQPLGVVGGPEVPAVVTGH